MTLLNLSFCWDQLSLHMLSSLQLLWYMAGRLHQSEWTDLDVVRPNSSLEFVWSLRQPGGSAQYFHFQFVSYIGHRGVINVPIDWLGLVIIGLDGLSRYYKPWQSPLHRILPVPGTEQESDVCISRSQPFLGAEVHWQSNKIPRHTKLLIASFILQHNEMLVFFICIIPRKNLGSWTHSISFKLFRCHDLTILFAIDILYISAKSQGIPELTSQSTSALLEPLAYHVPVPSRMLVCPILLYRTASGTFPFCRFPTEKCLGHIA